MDHSHLYAYQRDAVSFLASRKTALLAHEPGLGKTATSIAAADTVGAQRVLVLCMAVAKSHWAKEFSRFQKQNRAITIIHKATQTVPPTGVVIVNYDLISRTDTELVKRLMKHQWDVLICDEAHALKSRSANRTKHVYGKRCDLTGTSLAAVSGRVWLLTGTPMPSNASELWTHLRALIPDRIEVSPGLPMNEHQFIDRFCTWRDTPFGRKITGSRHLPDLRERMKDFMDRKKKADVLTDLPSLTFDTFVVNPQDASVPASVLRELGHHEMALADHPAFEAMMEEYGGDILSVMSRIARDTHVTTQRRLTGQIKAEIALDLVQQELSGNTKKMIVFAHHTAVIDRLMSGFADAGLGSVKIDGRDDSAERGMAVLAFQHNPVIRVFVGQLTAAGTSITLTAASDVLFVEASWVPSENVQAACRAHRIGQRDGVLARFLTLDGSLDRQIMSALTKKSRDIAELIDNEAPTPTN